LNHITAAVISPSKGISPGTC